jgi:shikimate kinase
VPDPPTIAELGPLVPPGGLALVGYRGTGKTTVGRILAARLGRPFVDADAELERRLGCTIRDLFARGDEATFRDHEQAILAELACRPGLILATGGGAVLREANRRALRDLGVVAWLRADPEAIARRLRADGGYDRPALTAAGTLAEIATVLTDRLPLYREVADFAVETDGRCPEDVADAVLSGWRTTRARRGDQPRVNAARAGGVP